MEFRYSKNIYRSIRHNELRDNYRITFWVDLNYYGIYYVELKDGSYIYSEDLNRKYVSLKIKEIFKLKEE